MTTQTTLTFTLEEFLTKFERRIDQQFAEVNQKMDKQSAEVNQKLAEVNQKMDRQSAEVNQKLAEVNQKMDRQYAEVNQTLNDVKIGQADLSAKVDGIDKRLSNQEFFNRSFFLAVIASLLGVAAKFFGVLPPDK